MATNEPAMDYKSTVLTPKTDFPQKGSLPQREPEMLARWEKTRLQERIAARRKDAPPFILHDGPPYANGHIHIGHALNKILKDIVVRHRTMAGFRSDYVPGWDCHGLPIEQKVMENLRKEKGPEKTPLEIRQACAAYAREWIGVQREEFKRLGVGGEWERPYVTMDPEYELGIVNALGALVEKGLVSKGFKPVHWDPVFETALAEAEIEYNDKHESPTIHLKFPLLADNAAGKALPAAIAALQKPSLVIWTTTPWTIPANLGVCVSGEFDYVGLLVAGETLIVAKGLLETFQKEAGVAGEVVATFSGAILDRLECAHPVFPGKRSLVMLGAHVTLEAGTGCVHTAPAHGVEDFQVGKQYGLEVFNPVDDRGRFSALYPEMQGELVFDANKKLIEKFRAEGSLVHAGKLIHSYPYSWRSHKPVIMRATEQWFMDLETDGLRGRALAEIANVQWIPAWGRDRIGNMVEVRPDWCLSRQRSWGVPIPSIKDTRTGESLLTKEIVDKFASFVATEGTDCWFARPVADFLPDAMKADAGHYEKEHNVLDVWFDSGASHLGVLEPRENLTWPADLYLEGGDQHRGWFQSSLWIGVGVKGAAPYRAVLTHGFVLDEKGEPMSKSRGNVVSPLKVMDQMGADVLRLWVASEEYRADLSIGQNLLTQVSSTYRRIRNTVRFLLGNVSDFDPARDAVPLAQMEEDDRWALARLDELVRRVRAAYDAYEFHRVYHLVNAFCVTDLGGVYLDCSKDRLYCSAPGDTTRRACQTVLHHIAEDLLKLLAPILCITADEAWACLPALEGRPDSVHLADLPPARDGWKDDALLARWEKLLAVREAVQAAIEPLRAKENKVIGNSLDAQVVLVAHDEATLAFLRGAEGLLPRLLIVSAVTVREGAGTDAGGPKGAGLRMSLAVTRAEGGKCERCWTYSPAVGSIADHPTLCARCADVVRRLPA